MVQTGLEHDANTQEKTGVSNSGGAKYGAVGDQIDKTGSELQFVTEAWTSLPLVVKSRILKIVQTTNLVEAYMDGQIIFRMETENLPRDIEEGDELW